MIALIDCNSFYASCEKIFRPDLKNKPVVVLSNNDSCIVAMSQEAKELGISRATPLFKIRDIINKNNVTVFSSNYTLYADISNRIMDILKDNSFNIEIYSIDEAFINLKGFTDPSKHCSKLKKLVEKSTGIPVSIGIGETKTLAKIANQFAKKNSWTQGIFKISHSDDSLLNKVNITSIWNVGWSYSEFLLNHNIRTAKDLKYSDDYWIKKNLTINGLRTVWELRGIPSINFETAIKQKKGIMCSRQFGKQVRQLEDLKEAVAEYASFATEKLRKQKSLCSYVTITIETDCYKAKEQYRNSISIAFPEPTAYLPEIITAAQKGLDEIFKSGIIYKRARIYLSEIIPDSRNQISLFNPHREKETALMKTIDKINKKHQRHTIRILSRGFKKEWNMKRERLSPRYTTNWNEILKIN